MNWLSSVGTLSFALIVLMLEVHQQKKTRHPVSVGWDDGFWLCFSIFVRGFVVPQLFLLADLTSAASKFKPLFELSGLPFVPQVVIYFLILDFFFYLVHWHFHRFSFLWKFHSVHHSSTEIHALSGFKQSFFELVLHSLALWGFGTIAGVHPDVLFASNALFMMICVWQHSRLQLPNLKWSPLRYLVMTPSDHKIHHELISGKNHQNLGFFLTFWDRIAGSYSDRQNANASYGIAQESFPRHSKIKRIFYPFFS